MRELDAGNDAHPALGAQRVLAGLHPRDPTADVEVAPPDEEGGDHAEIKRLPERAYASGIQPINSRVVRDLKAT
jgi:hypothetical protein